LGGGTWFAWGVPVLVQTPIALGWAVGTRYFLEERRRTRLRNAFAHYLSPSMADRIADANFDPTPGGEVVEATIIFTDLQGFTTLSEGLGDPRKLSEVLIAYFTNTTQHVVENQGTIIKYIGDAVLAVWGAPLPDAEHPIKATRAAWRMHLASGKEVLGHKLITRVGIHTGEVLAGNLGSAYRFDYTVIGDAVNFAARLEALNKYLGTRILISDATVSRLNGEFITRRLGDFKVVGKDQTVGIHELTVPKGEAEPMPWLEAFDAGTAAFRCGDLDEAERRMREVCELRGGHDGPAKFYLGKITALRSEGLPSNWTGTIELTSK
jgi:adenylate cyclase